MKNVLLISGSNSQNSINYQLILALKSFFDKSEITLLDLRKLHLPLYNVDDEAQGIPHEAIELRRHFDANDCIVMAVPEYNGSLPAFFKNAIDWLSRVEAPDYRFFKDKKTIIVNATPGFGGNYVLSHMKDIVRKLGGEQIETMNFSRFGEISRLSNTLPEIYNAQIKLEFQGIIDKLGKS